MNQNESQDENSHPDEFSLLQKSKIKIIIKCLSIGNIGHSNIANGLAVSLSNIGFDVYLFNENDKFECSEHALELTSKTKFAQNNRFGFSNHINIFFGNEEDFKNTRAKYKIGISSPNSTRLKKKESSALNRMDCILTFSSFCKGTIKHSGVVKNIEILNPAIDDMFLEHNQKISDGKFRYLTFCSCVQRSNIYQIVQSFVDAFSENENVELVIKTNEDCNLNFISDYSIYKKLNIKIIDSYLSDQELYSLLCSSDCLIHASHGDGFGSFVFQAAGVGLPIIMTNWSTPVEYIDKTMSFPISLYSEKPFSKNGKINGSWANANKRHMEKLINDVINDKNESQKRGKLAAEYIKNNHSWEVSANKLVPLIFKWEEARKGKVLTEKNMIKKKLTTVINAGNDIDIAKRAVERFSLFSDDIYLTTTDDSVKKSLNGMVKAIVSKQEELVLLTKSLILAESLVMTVSDTMYFMSNPLFYLSEEYDEYVFEVYDSYVPVETKRSVSGVLSQIPNFDADVKIGVETRNECLISRPSKNREKNIQYLDIKVINDVKLTPINGKSKLGFNLLSMSDFLNEKWEKICTYQFPEGTCEPKVGINEPSPSTLVSIVIATFGRKALLKRCVDSIFACTKTPFELIIIDNGSSDGTSDFIKNEMKMRKNIKHVRQKTNLGYIKAINIGISRAIGEYVVLFDDDAYLSGIEDDELDWAESYIQELKDSSVMMVGNKFKNKIMLVESLLLQCVMFRKNMSEIIGFFDEKFINYGGDEDIAMRIKIKGLRQKEKKVKLEHKDNLIPIEVKKRELIAAESKLKKKYEGVLNGRGSDILSGANSNTNSTILNN